MKPVKNLLFALLLVCAITSTTLAGEVPIPPAPALPQSTPNAILLAEDGTSTSPLAEQSGETVETSDYLLFETVKALLSLY